MTPGGTSDDDKWMVIKGRRWRRTDPSLPEDVVAALTSHLGADRLARARDALEQLDALPVPVQCVEPPA